MQKSPDHQPQKDTAASRRKKRVFFCAGFAVLAVLLFYFFWWPLSGDKAYRFTLHDTDCKLNIVGDNKEEKALSFELAPLSSLKALRAGRSLKEQPLVWESDDPSVASVDQKGLVRAVGKGSAVITGRLGTQIQQAAVEVSYPLQGIAFSAPPAEIIKGRAQTLTIEPIPREAELPEDIHFFSASPERISIDDKGQIRGIRVGRAVVSVRGAGFEGDAEISVLSPMTGISMRRIHKIVTVGDQLGLSVSFQPADTTDDKSLSWESSDPAVAAVDERGLLTAHNPGKTKITVRCGVHKAEREIEVFAPLKGIQFQEEKIYLLKEEEAALLLKYEPENTTDDKTAIYTLSDEEIISLGEDGLVKALKAGEAVVTASVGDFTARAVVVVRVPMTGIALGEGSRSLARGSEMRVPVNFFPADTNDDRSLSWESSDPAVLSVEDGLIKAHKAGKAFITARCGDFTAEAEFTVIVPVNAVGISQRSLSLNKGGSSQIRAWVLPEDTTEDKSIRFSSSDSAVATVDERGNIKALAAGSCRISASHGSFSASCEIRVLSPMTGISLNQSQLTLLEGNSSQLKVSFSPWDTTDSRNVSWSSSQTAVATVDGSGNVRAVGAGDCIITAKAGRFSASASLHVNPFIHVVSLTLTPPTAHFTVRGETLRLMAQVLPENATAPAVSFTSSNPGVISVSGDGVLTAHASGQSVITARAENITASVTVTAELPLPPKVVVIDPGHGGIFPGGVFGGRQEKLLNLKTAQYCKAYLEANYHNVAVYLTHSDDRSLSSDLKEDLMARAAFGKSVGADILISFHYNGSPNHDVSGTIAYYSMAGAVSEQSRRLAQLLVDNIAALGLRNQGVRTRFYDEVGLDPNQGDWYGIVRHSASHRIPAVLLEHCCMDYDISFVDSDEDLYRFAVQDALAIAQYLGLEHK